MAMSEYHSKDNEAAKLDPRMNFLHDWYNILTLPGVRCANIFHIKACYDAPSDPDPLTIFSLTRVSNSGYFSVIWWVFLVYILIDTMWLLIYPRSVVAPGPILIHHFTLITAWLIIFAWPGYEFYMSASLLVEVSTFFLIAKRQATRGTMLHSCLVLGDHISWITVRSLGVPLMNYNGFHIWKYLSAIKCADENSVSLRCYWNSGLFTVVAGTAISIQNLMWTMDKYFNKKSTQKEP